MSKRIIRSSRPNNVSGDGFRALCFADAGRADKQKTAQRPLGIVQTCFGECQCVRDRIDGGSLTDERFFDSADNFRTCQSAPVVEEIEIESAISLKVSPARHYVQSSVLCNGPKAAG